MMFSRKTRLAGAALLMASMALGGTAFGQEFINTDKPNISGSYAGDLAIFPSDGGTTEITVALPSGSLTVAGGLFVRLDESDTDTGIAVRLTLGTGSKTSIGDLFYAQNSVVKMESDSELAAGEIWLSQAELIMGDRAKITSGDSFGVENSRVALGKNASITTASGVNVTGGGEISLGDGAKIEAAEDFEIYNGRVILDNSTINTNGGVHDGDGYGFNIGLYDDGSVVDTGQKAELIIGGNSTLNADGFFTIKPNAVVELKPDSKLTISLYKATASSASPADILAARQESGAFLLGDIVKPINFDDPAYAELKNFGNGWADQDPDRPVDGYLAMAPGTVNDGYSGLFHLGAGSEATIDGRAIFGAVFEGSLYNDDDIRAALESTDRGLRLDSGSYLKITGNAWFLQNSMLTLDGDASLTENVVEVNGTITIEENALVKVINGKAGDVLLVTNTGFTNNQSLQNPVYSFYIDGNKMLIDSMASNTVMESFGQNSNYAGAGALINSIFDNASISAELKNRLATNLQEIYFASGDLAETALKQLIGEEALAANTAVQNSLSQGNQALGQRFQALRGNSSPSAGAGDTENRLWLGGFGQWSQQDDEDNIYGYDYNSVGVMLGYDREIAALPGLTVGFNGSWNSGTVENNDGLAESDIDSFGLGIYGLYEFAGGFFLEGDFGYGHATNDSEIDLAVVGGKKRGDFDIDSFQAGLNLGYDYRFEGGAILTPSAGLRYTHIKQDGWRERIVSDPQNMAIANWFDDSTQNILEIPISLKLAKTFDQGGGYAITPELRVGAVFTATEPNSSLRMGFVGSGDSIAINGIDPSRARFTAGGGFKAQLNDTVDLFAGYDLEARSGYMGHSASLGLGFSF